ncbi:uncharacterized protein LOC144099130 [Amblyomma americanum]|uniref:PID domain-containing protein n=1 Tax=Amblyomma americanum TaxID=6943 RepID=A0AAQ4FG64_AMBAM
MSSTTPICRCRVLYLGSAVPHITKDGLQGIQEPLRELYPEQGPLSARGIDSWLSVWSNGLLLENVDESLRQHVRFFPIETLHYCAAVRYVMVPGSSGTERVEKFLPLDSPFARHAGPQQPPLFACILRRTTGIKVLECHAFICKKEAAANALVRCCFHAYADCTYAKQLEENPYALDGPPRRAQSVVGLDTVQKVEAWRHQQSEPTTSNGVPHANGGSILLDDDTEDDEGNYKVWTGPAPRELVYMDTSGTLRSVQSTAATQSRMSRPRQLAIPSRPPPPPLPPLPPPSSSKANGHKEQSKSKKKSKSKSSNSSPQQPPLPMPPPHLNGYSVISGYSGNHPPPPMMIHSERMRRPPERPMLYSAEEPSYVPAVRAMSPTASYQPGMFPHEQYFMQNYSTAPRPHGGKHRGGEHPPSSKPGKEHRRSNGHHDEAAAVDGDSPFNTGIYRRKGHLNERAFSYSIRQEHRSRSNSLANLHFLNGAPDGSGDPGPSGMDKKDRELAQLVGDLDLRDNGGYGGPSHRPVTPDTNFTRKKASSKNYAW